MTRSRGENRGAREPREGRRRRDLRKARVVGFLVAWLIRAVCVTLRVRMEDRGGVVESPPGAPMIWVFWHNRMFVLPYYYRKFLPSRRGAILTSASGDGEIIAEVLRRFGVDAVRGSSSRRSVSALLGMRETIASGGDVVVTPDGPRGPRYQLQPGLVKLAQLTGAPVFPVHVRYHRTIKFKTWDRFRVPWPFSRVDVVFDPLRPVPETDTDEAFEAARASLETQLRDGAEGSA